MNFKPIWNLLNRLKTLLFVLYFASCGENMDQKETLTLEHKMMLGKWFEKETTSLEDTTFWEFGMVDLKWRSFEHYYRIDKDQLEVSKVVYQIRLQTQDTVVLQSTDNQKHTLIRCKSGVSQINP